MKNKIEEYLNLHKAGKLTSEQFTIKIISEFRRKLPKMREAIPNANKHFTTDYDNLPYDYQHEHEGLMWGWQDCVEKINKILETK